MASLLDAFAASVAAHGPRVAIIEGDGRAVTFSELDARAKGFAGAWRARGLSAGDRVLLAMPLGADLYAALAALWSLGATAVLPEPAMGLKGVRNAVRLAGCQGLVASGAYTWLRVLLPGLWGKPHYRPAMASPAPMAAIDPDALALISFTSGTTGVPKAIPRSHGFLQAQRAAVAPLLESEKGEIDLVAFPVFVLINLAAGRCSVLPNWPMRRLDKVTPETLSNWIETQGATRALLPPKLCATLSEAEIPSSLNAVFTGGGPVFPDVIEALSTNRPEMQIVSVYGSTEAEPIAELPTSEVSSEDRAAMLAGNGLLAGHPVSGVEVRIIDDEIVVAGDHVNEGYLDPARDRETKIKQDGRIWHRTGDAGKIDAEGRLWLWGRHGGNIGGLYPFCVETAARYWAGVEAVALVELDGKPALAIQGDRVQLPEWQNHARDLGVMDIRHVRKMPMDRRHHSKIDMPALKRKLR